MPVEEERRAGERAARHVPPLLRDDVRFVPGDRTFPRLVRVDLQAGDAVARASARDGLRVRAGEGVVRPGALGDDRIADAAELAFVQRPEDGRDAHHDRKLVDETGGDVAATDRNETSIGFVRVAATIFLLAVPDDPGYGFANDGAANALDVA